MTCIPMKKMLLEIHSGAGGFFSCGVECVAGAAVLTAAIEREDQVGEEAVDGEKQSGPEIGEVQLQRRAGGSTKCTSATSGSDDHLRRPGGGDVVLANQARPSRSTPRVLRSSSRGACTQSPPLSKPTIRLPCRHGLASRARLQRVPPRRSFSPSSLGASLDQVRAQAEQGPPHCSGGMELLFSNEPSHDIAVPRFYDPAVLASPAPPTAPNPASSTPTDIRFLIWWLREYLLADKGRPELFSQGETMCVFPLALAPNTLTEPGSEQTTWDLDPHQLDGLGAGGGTRLPGAGQGRDRIHLDPPRRMSAKSWNVDSN